MTHDDDTRETVINAWANLFADVLREDVAGRDQPRDDDDAVEGPPEETAAERPSSEAA